MPLPRWPPLRLATLVVLAFLGSSTGPVAGGPKDAPGRWAFEPPPDPFRSDALLDLRSLNERLAGEQGYVSAGPDGDLRLGDGTPVRFWAVNTTVGRESPWKRRPLGRAAEPNLARHARFLAKRGVNLVRLHAHVNPDPKAAPTPRLEDVNGAERDWIWRTVAAMRTEGIYTAISPYWANTFEPRAFGFDTDVPHALLYADERLKAAYKAWWRALLLEKNPYTGTPLAQDPSVALLQVQNEDSLLFWTVDRLRGSAREALGRRFGAWAAERHGSLEKALDAWGGDRLKGDDLGKGVLDFHPVWALTREGKGGNPRRLADQTEFWASTMRAFHAEVARYLREDLGCRALVNAGNWKTADPAALEDVERWTYAATDVLAVNRYFAGLHLGPQRGWAVVPGDRFTSPSVLRDAADRFPLAVRQWRGKPMIVTESGWVAPGAYAAEGPPLVAAYGALLGIDGFCWFATGDDEWSPPQSANGYLPSQAKWSFGEPDVLGGFPAAALIYRRGLVRRGEPAVVERRSLDDLWARVPPGLPESASYDPNRDAGDAARPGARARLDPRAFLVGPVVVEEAPRSLPPKATGLDAAIGDGGRVVRSGTKELLLDTGRGLFTIDAPRAQGVVGFLKGAPPVHLSATSVRCGNPYASVLVVSLDDLPISASERVLVQVTTPCRPTGWRETAGEVRPERGSPEAGAVVEDVGRAPWQVARADVTVTIANPVLATGSVLDPNGEAVRPAAVERVDGGLRLTFPEDALYVVLRAAR